MHQFTELYHKCDVFLRRQMDFYRIPALAYVFTDCRKTLHSGYYGYADLEKKIRLSAEHVFSFGSIGKSFTCILLLQAQEQGLLKLENPVTDYLPWFEIQSDYRSISLHDLMTHSSGLPMGTDQETESLGEVWNLRRLKTVFAPGEQFYYSNAGYKTLGLVLEKIYAKPYVQIIQEKILEPLGMQNTFPALISANRPRYVQAWASQFDDRPFNRAHPLVPAHWLETSTADGCISSTPEDLAVYARMLLNRTQYAQGSLLSEQSFEQMTRSYIPFQDMAYGYGLMIHQGDGYTHLSHSGRIPGYVAFMDLDMDSGLGVVIMLVEPATAAVRPYLMDSLRAAVLGKDLPPLPKVLSPYQVQNGADYCGVYGSGRRSFEVLQDGDYLWLDDGAEKNRLEPRGKDQFYLDHPGFNLFLLKFKKETGTSRMQEVYYGEEGFVRSGVDTEFEFKLPEAWQAYCGHYRSHNPWLTNFRIIKRRGSLYFVYPSGAEMELISQSDGSFMLKSADNPLLCESLCFSAVVNDKALLVNLSGCEYYRFFTP